MVVVVVAVVVVVVVSISYLTPTAPTYYTHCVDEQGLKAEKEKTDLRVRATRDVKLKEAVMAGGIDPASLTGTGTVLLYMLCRMDNVNQCIDNV